MLPKYHQQFHHQQLFQSPAATASLDAGLATCSSSSPSGSSPQHSSSSASSTSPAARMYPYVSAAAAHHHHQQQAAAAVAFGAASGSMVPSFSSTASTAALAAAVDAAADKSCRYTAGLAANVAPADSMVNYTLGHHHQNGAAVSAASSVSAASASMAVAAQFYHQAASAVVDPLNSCSQPAAPGGQPIPDIPRYPWMSITGTRRHDDDGLIVRRSPPSRRMLIKHAFDGYLVGNNNKPSRKSALFTADNHGFISVPIGLGCCCCINIKFHQIIHSIWTKH
jgi:Antp family protein